MSLTMANVDVKDDWVGTRDTELGGLMIQGDELTIQGCELLSKLIKHSTKRGLGSLQCSPITLRLSPLLLWNVYYIIQFSLDYPSPTLVSHPCLYLSAHPISHSFWRSVSCGDPDITVQGSCPHKWGQDISDGYLMRRWQLILELLLHYTLMAASLHLCFPLGRSGRLPLVACRFLLPWSRFAKNRIVLGDMSWQFGLSSFVLGHFFLLGMGLGLDMKWTRIAKFFGPTITPQNPTVWLLGQRGGFWCPRAYVTASRVLSPVSARASSPA